jgi:CspA family cold shock protein
MEEEFVLTEDQAMLADDEAYPEDEEIAVEEREEVPEDGFTLGTVKWFSRMKGWGFIEPDGGDRDVFVHYESIVGEGFRNLEKGERVKFRIEDSPKGPKAAQVSSLDTAF